MIEQSIVHLPELVKDIDRPVSIYLVHLSSFLVPLRVLRADSVVMTHAVGAEVVREVLRLVVGRHAEGDSYRTS
jgi:hypothetical protein